MHAPYRQLSLIAPANHFKYAYKVNGGGIIEKRCLFSAFPLANISPVLPADA